MSEKKVLKKKTYTNESQQVINVAYKNASSKKLYDREILDKEEFEMDRLVKESVRAAIKKAKVCGKPIAVLDRKTGKACLVYGDGRKVVVG